MSESLQLVIVGVIVAWSLWRVLQKILPGTMGSLQRKLAAQLRGAGFSKTANWISPVAESGGCGSGCGSCASRCK